MSNSLSNCLFVGLQAHLPACALALSFPHYPLNLSLNLFFFNYSFYHRTSLSVLIFSLFYFPSSLPLCICIFGFLSPSPSLFLCLSVSITVSLFESVSFPLYFCVSVSILWISLCQCLSVYLSIFPCLCLSVLAYNLEVNWNKQPVTARITTVTN